MDLIHRVIRLPALREIHLNDEAEIGFSNGDVGCYCDHCVAEYERDSGEPPPREVDWASPSWWRWVQHRMEAWTAVHAYFREEIKKVRPDVVVGIQHSPKVVTFNDNPWLSGIDLSRDAEAMDVLCTDPYHHIHYSHFTYRPMRRIQAEATRALAGATVARSLFIYPQGFMPPSGSLEMTRRDGFMAGAVPFALGAENISPYTFDLCQIIPGYYDGLKEASRLIPYFEKTRPYSAATLIKPSQTEIYGYPEKHWGREVLAIWPDVMNQVGLPWRWVFDRRLPDADGALSGPVILPETHCLTAGTARRTGRACGGRQRAALGWADAGRGVVRRRRASTPARRRGRAFRVEAGRFRSPGSRGHRRAHHAGFGVYGTRSRRRDNRPSGRTPGACSERVRRSTRDLDGGYAAIQLRGTRRSRRGPHPNRWDDASAERAGLVVRRSARGQAVAVSSKKRLWRPAPLGPPRRADDGTVPYGGRRLSRLSSIQLSGVGLRDQPGNAGSGRGGSHDTCGYIFRRRI